MKEIAAILDAHCAATAVGRRTALATVVRVAGSSYRRPGARMLVIEGGAPVGSVSGGCLEADVIERALAALRSGQPSVVTYDTTDDGDILYGAGLGCSGVVEILIEPLPNESMPNHFRFLGELLQRRQAGVVATVFRAAHSAPSLIGRRLMLSESGEVPSDVPDPALAACILRDARVALADGRSRHRRYPSSGGDVETFLEALLPPLPLVLCGAGNDAQPLARLAKELGWHVTVTDHRPAFATRSRFPDADAVVLAAPEDLCSLIGSDARAAVVLMTHNFLRDQALLEALLPTSVRYIGILGPKSRTERLLQEMRNDGYDISPLQTERLHSPAGLDIGADTPEQIALSIVAEIQAVTARRTGEPLRQRPGPIYAPGSDTASAWEGASRRHTREARPLCSL
jgi:xanthine/CO dehydrogenase XdhC/CoxF family maturation factor